MLGDREGRRWHRRAETYAAAKKARPSGARVHMLLEVSPSLSHRRDEGKLPKDMIAKPHLSFPHYASQTEQMNQNDDRCASS